MLMATINILERKTMPGTKYPLQQIKFQKPDLEDNMHNQTNEVYFRPDAVTVLLADSKTQTFLFTRQFRLPTFLNGNESGERQMLTVWHKTANWFLSYTA